MSLAPARADVRTADLVMAAVLTAVVFGGSLLALSHARLQHRAELPVIDPGLGIPIAVRPVADLPAGSGKQASGRSKSGRASTVPRAWRRKVPTPPTPAPTITPELPWSSPDEPTPQTERPKPAPQPSNDPPPVEPSDPVDPEAAPEAPEDPALEGDPVEDPAQAEGEGDEDPGEGAGADAGDGQAEGSGEAEGGGDGEAGNGGGGTDPLLERAIAFYRARLVAWFSSRFRVTGSGLSAAQLAKYRVRVHVEVGEDLRIVDYQILSSDHPAFEKAAYDMLEKLRGASLPAPPENYPGAVQRQLTVTFTCTEDACD